MNRKIKNYILLLVILLYILFYKFIIFTKIPAYSETITAGFLIILLSVLFLIYGYRKDKKTKVKDDLLKNTIFFVVITQSRAVKRADEVYPYQKALPQSLQE